METGAVEDRIAAEQNLNLTRLVTAILQAKRSIFLTGLAAALCGLVAILFLKPYYTATTEVMPPQMGSSSTLSMLSQFAGMGGGGAIAGLGSAIQSKTQADSFVVLLSAWPVQQALAKQFDLMRVYDTHTPEETRKALAKHTAIKATNGFVTVAVTDPDRERAAAITNGYIDQVRVFMRGMALTGASQRRLFYEGQLAKVKEDLAQAEANFKQMQQSSRMISLDSQARVALQGAAELRSQITAREVELQRLRSYRTDANAQVQITETELSALRGQLARVESSTESGYSGTGLSSVPGAELTFVRASRELKYQEALYELMVKQYDAARIDEASDAPIVQVVEPALPPERKAGPPRTSLVLAAFLAGIAIGLIRVLIRFWRSRMDTANAAELAALRLAATTW